MEEQFLGHLRMRRICRWTNEPVTNKPDSSVLLTTYIIIFLIQYTSQMITGRLGINLEIKLLQKIRSRNL